MLFGSRGDKKKEVVVSSGPEFRAMKRINRLRKGSVSSSSLVDLNLVLRRYLREKFGFSLTLTVEEVIPRLDKKKVPRSVKLDLAHVIIQLYKRQYYDPSPLSPREFERLTRLAYQTLLEVQSGRKVASKKSKPHKDDKDGKSVKEKEKSSSKAKVSKSKPVKAKHEKPEAKKVVSKKKRGGFFYRLFTTEVKDKQEKKRDKKSTTHKKPITHKKHTSHSKKSIHHKKSQTHSKKSVHHKTPSSRKFSSPSKVGEKKISSSAKAIHHKKTVTHKKHKLSSKKSVVGVGNSSSYLKVVSLLDSVGSRRSFHVDWSSGDVRRLYLRIRKYYDRCSDVEKRILYPGIMNLFHLS